MKTRKITFVLACLLAFFALISIAQATSEQQPCSCELGDCWTNWWSEKTIGNAWKKDAKEEPKIETTDLPNPGELEDKEENIITWIQRKAEEIKEKAEETWAYLEAKAEDPEWAKDIVVMSTYIKTTYPQYSKNLRRCVEERCGATKRGYVFKGWHVCRSEEITKATTAKLEQVRSWHPLYSLILILTAFAIFLWYGNYRKKGKLADEEDFSLGTILWITSGVVLGLIVIYYTTIEKSWGIWFTYGALLGVAILVIRWYYISKPMGIYFPFIQQAASVPATNTSTETGQQAATQAKCPLCGETGCGPIFCKNGLGRIDGKTEVQRVSLPTSPDDDDFSGEPYDDSDF